MSIPSHYKALILSSYSSSPTIETLPTPPVSPGTALVKIVAFRVGSNTRDHLSGKIFPTTLPMSPGNYAVGRVAALGPDAVSLSPGALVYIDTMIHDRDNPDAGILLGTFNGGPGSPASKLAEHEYRNGTFAQYAKVPLENCIPLNEKRLCGELGYPISSLVSIGAMALTMRACEDAVIVAGTTVVIAPATGTFSGLAVPVALARGANVIATSRNAASLRRLVDAHKTPRLTTCVFTGDSAADVAALTRASSSFSGNPQGIQAYIDWSPPSAANSNHISSCMTALSPYGTAVIMGFVTSANFPYGSMIIKNQTLKARFMAGYGTYMNMARLLENGDVKLGKAGGVEVVELDGMDKLEEAMTMAEEVSGWNRVVTINP